MSLDAATLAHLRGTVWPALESGMGLPSGLLNAVATWETRGTFDTRAYNAGSGARGIFQLTPIALRQVAQDTGMQINPTNPYQASAAAAALLQRYNRLFQGQLPLVVAAYNAGEGTVRGFVKAVASQGRGRLPAETRDYIVNVTGML